MTVTIHKTKNGKSVLLYRGYTPNASLSATQYLPPTKFEVGTDEGTITENTNDLTNPIPILDGTVCDDGSNTMTGSSGADNSTDNVLTYKNGANTSDATAQNLVADGTGTNVLKIWTISDLTSAGSAADSGQYTGLWLYIKDTTTLLKFKTSGTCLEIKLGSDSSNYYSETYTAADLSTGWNWLPMGILGDLTETGTVSGAIDTFIIEITTNNAGDEFAEGEVVYDMLRQWTILDVQKTFSVGYPAIDHENSSVTVRCYLSTTNANSFLIDSIIAKNDDASELATDVATFDEDSKSDGDEFIFTITTQLD